MSHFMPKHHLTEWMAEGMGISFSGWAILSSVVFALMLLLIVAL